MAAILLAEDSPTHTELIRSLLEKDAHAVNCVTNGREAIDAIEQSRPDLIVTDLRMPEMNGLELVKQAAEQFPNIPSVVVTARGSENLAVDALALGAANFVPKNSLGNLLNYVVRSTLQMSEVDRLYRRFSGRLLHPEFSFTLDNHATSIEPAVLFIIQSLAAGSRMTTIERIRVGTAVASAILNSICYGNLEVKDTENFVSRTLAGEDEGETAWSQRAESAPYAQRGVQLNVSIGEHDTRIMVSHDGPGRMTRMRPAPGTPESFELEQCRGLVLMTSFVDDLHFHADYSEVVMVKRHDA